MKPYRTVLSDKDIKKLLQMKSNGTKMNDLCKIFKIGQSKLYKLLEENCIKTRKSDYLDKEIDIINEYKNGIDTKIIAENNNCSECNVFRVAKRNNINLRSKQHKHNTENHYKAERITVDGIAKLKKKCPLCEDTVIIDMTSVRKDRVDEWKCKKCSFSLEVTSKKSSTRQKMENNKTGYIGISKFRKHKSCEYAGYSLQLAFMGKKLLNQKYKDEYLKESTLLQAAFDRDMYIIENNLPHRRNFTDKQIIELHQTIGANQLSQFEKKIKSGAISTI